MPFWWVLRQGTLDDCCFFNVQKPSYALKTDGSCSCLSINSSKVVATFWQHLLGTLGLELDPQMIHDVRILRVLEDLPWNFRLHGYVKLGHYHFLDGLCEVLGTKNAGCFQRFIVLRKSCIALQKAALLSQKRIDLQMVLFIAVLDCQRISCFGRSHWVWKLFESAVCCSHASCTSGTWFLVVFLNAMNLLHGWCGKTILILELERAAPSVLSVYAIHKTLTICWMGTCSRSFLSSAVVNLVCLINELWIT